MEHIEFGEFEEFVKHFKYVDVLLILTVILSIIGYIVLIYRFNKLCRNVDKLAKKFCPDPVKPVQDLDRIAADLPELHPGDHVMDDDTELVVADRNGNYYKCNRADTMAFYAVLHRAHLKPVPKK